MCVGYLSSSEMLRFGNAELFETRNTGIDKMVVCLPLGGTCYCSWIYRILRRMICSYMNVVQQEGGLDTCMDY